MPTTQVGSHTVFYDDLGAGHPLLFLTGLGATRFSWWKQIEPFTARYRVINMDNRDAGDSALATGPYTVGDMAEDVAGVIQNLKLSSTYVVGISLGGAITTELAIRHPELVSKIVLVSTGAGGQSSVQPQPEYMALFVRDEAEDLEARTRRVYTAIAGKGYMDNHPEDLNQVVKHQKAKPMSTESYQRQFGAVLTYDTSSRLDKISAPTLVIHGDYDPLIPYGNGQYLADHIKGARLSTFPGVGHLPHIEATEQFNRVVIEFLG
ncbi:MAG: alpha/beta hydrolase [Thermodesulfobacteriota bacterium]